MAKASQRIDPKLLKSQDTQNLRNIMSKKLMNRDMFLQKVVQMIEHVKVGDAQLETLKAQIISGILNAQVQKADEQRVKGLGDQEWHLFDEEELLLRL